MKNPPSTSTLSRNSAAAAAERSAAPVNGARANGSAPLHPPAQASSPPPPEPTRQPGDPPLAEELPGRLNRLRYLRIVFFFVGLMRRILWWYYIVPRLFGEIGRGYTKSGETARFGRWAADFRELAVRMGGVMIKLGQFVSSRVDILPPEVTTALAGLQDEVPVVAFSTIESTLSRELGIHWRSHFAQFNEIPVAAASLGQVHRAQLTSGDRVVVKVQRPHIDQLVHTDLSALDVVVRLAMRFRFVRRRANLPLLLDEFARVLWQEVDYSHEALNAQRFQEMFANDMGVYVPAVYGRFTTRRVLVLEDVTTIKINDYAALEAAGIDRHAVARRLLETYLEQIFIEHFFHADPHPGNLFVYPLPGEGASRGSNSSQDTQPFYLIFVDFGMVGRLTPLIAEGLRETLIAVITRDVKRMVSSFQRLGVLLPEANTRRVEEAVKAVFDEFWGMNMSELSTMDFDVMSGLARNFSDLLYALPFQVPQDFVYLGRSVGILSGMCTGLDPLFDPWKIMQPFTQRLLAENGEAASLVGQTANLLTLDNLRTLFSPQTINTAVQEGRTLLMQGLTLPTQLRKTLETIDLGEVEVQVKANDYLERRLSRLDRIGRQIVLALIFGSVALSSTFLYVNDERDMGRAGFLLAFMVLVVIITRRNT